MENDILKNQIEKPNIKKIRIKHFNDDFSVDIGHFDFKEDEIILVGENITPSNDFNSEDKLFYSSISTYKVLVICKGNTCRSIMFQSYLNSLKKANYEVFSEGIKNQNSVVEKKH